MTLWAAPAGLVLAAVVWLLFRIGGTVTDPLDALQARLAADKVPTAPTTLASTNAASEAIATPLFALTTGPGAVSDISVRLDGIAISPRGGKAALVAIDSKPSDWLALGATRDGVTLMEVYPTKVVVDTAIGFKEVSVGQQSAPSGAPSAASFSNAIPPGAHLPPPPASAPH